MTSTFAVFARLAALGVSLTVGTLTLPPWLRLAFPDPSPAPLVPHLAAASDVADWLPELPLLHLEWKQPGAQLRRVWSERLQPLLAASEVYRRFEATPQHAQLLAGLGMLQFATGVEPLALLESLAGEELSFSLIAAPGAGEKPVALFAVRYADAEVARDAIGRLEPLARMDSKRKVERSTHLGANLLRVDDAWLAALGPFLVLGTDRSVLDRCLRNVTGEGNGSAVRSFVDQVRSRTSPDASIRGFVRREALAAAFPAGRLHEEPLVHLLFGDTFDALANATLLRFELADSQHGPGLGLHVVAERTLTSAERASAFPSEVAKATRLPRLRANGSALVLELRRDLGAWWRDRSQVLDPSTERGFAKFETDLGPFFPRDLGDEVIPELVGDWQLVIARQDYPEGAKPSVEIPAFALVLPAKDAEVTASDLSLALTSLLGIANLERAQGRKAPWRIYTESTAEGGVVGGRFDPGRPVGEDPVHYNVAPCLARAGSFVVISTSRALLDQVRTEIEAAAANSPADSAGLSAGVHGRMTLDGATIAALIAADRDFLVSRTMLDEGKSQAEASLQWDAIGEIARAVSGLEITTGERGDDFALSLEVALRLPEPQR